MKKTLLSLAMLASSSIAFAGDWKTPVYSGPYQPLTAGDTVYIYNTESKQFLTEGNDWGTHASVGAFGLKFIVNEYAEEGAAWDGKTYTIRDYSVVKGDWKNLFINAEGLYVDRSSQDDYFFSFVDKGNNTYGIVGADLNPIYKSSGEMEGYVVGHFTGYVNTRDGIDTGTGVIYDYNGVDNNYGEGEFNTTWAFVSIADYAAYELQAATYEAAMKLQNRIEEAELMGVSGIEAEKSVCDNTSSTLSALNDAIASIDAKILEYYEKTVTPSNPVDLTYLIKNPACDDTSGWSNEIGASTWENANMSAGWQTGWEEGSFIDSYINIWGATLSGAVSQTLTGLPNGIYSFSLSALAEKDGASVFAAGNAKSIPADSKGHKYEIITNVTTGILPFGIRQDEECTNWLCMDNAHIRYYGKGIEAYKYWLAELKETAPDAGDIMMQTALVDEYKAMLDRVDQADTEEKILAIVNDYEELLSRMSLNAAAYTMLIDEMEESELLGTSEEVNEYYGSLINDFIQTEVQPALDELALDTEGVNSLRDRLADIYNEAQNYVWNAEKLASELEKAATIYSENKATCPASAIDEYLEFMNNYESIDQSQLKNADVLNLLDRLYAIEFNLNLKDEPASDDNPIDYTAKIFNPSFDGVDGWVNDGWATFSNNTWYGFANEEGASSGDGNYLNLWNTSNARGYQQLTGLPAGAYTISCGAYADKEGLVLYANEQTREVEVGQNGNNEYMRIYSLDVVVGEDGTLEFGVKNTNGGEMWAMIDEVHLAYKGTESEILTSISSVSSASTDNAIYSLTGSRLSSPLRSGIYIQNGKKVLVK